MATKLRKWLLKENAYSLIKKLAVCVLLYNLASAITYSYGGRVFISAFLGGSLITYIAILLISLTPKGKYYYSNYFRFSIILLIFSSFTNISWQLHLIEHRQKLDLTLIITSVAFISYFVGLILGYNADKSKNSKGGSNDSPRQNNNKTNCS